MPLGQRIARIAPNGTAPPQSAQRTPGRRGRRTPEGGSGRDIHGAASLRRSPQRAAIMRADRRGSCLLVAGSVELGTVHIKRSHGDEDMLAEGIGQATRDERITSYFTKRFLEYLRWLEEGRATASSSITPSASLRSS